MGQVAVRLDPPATHDDEAALGDAAGDALEQLGVDPFDPFEVGNRITGEDEIVVLLHAVESGAERRPHLVQALLPLPEPHRVDVGVPDHVQQAFACGLAHRPHPSSGDGTTPAPGGPGPNVHGRARPMRGTGPATSSSLRTTAWRADFALVRWTPWLVNNGAGGGISPLVSDWLSVDATVAGAGGGQKWLHYANGSSATVHDFAPHRVALRPGTRRELRPSGGRSSSGVLPFFNLVTDEGGVVVAIGWSGQWRAEFGCDAGGEVVLRAGLDRTRFRLEAGEKVRGPQVVLLFWEGAGAWPRAKTCCGGGCSRRQVGVPGRGRRRGGAGWPPGWPCSAATWGETAAEVHGRCIDQIVANDLPFERYWVDAGLVRHRLVARERGRVGPQPRTVARHGIRPIADRPHGGNEDGVVVRARARRREVSWRRSTRSGSCTSGTTTPCFARRPRPKRTGTPTGWRPRAAGPSSTPVMLSWTWVTPRPGQGHGPHFRKDNGVGIDVYRHDFNFAPLPFFARARRPRPGRCDRDEVRRRPVRLFRRPPGPPPQAPHRQLRQRRQAYRRRDAAEVRFADEVGLLLRPVGHQCQTSRSVLLGALPCRHRPHRALPVHAAQRGDVRPVRCPGATSSTSGSTARSRWRSEMEANVSEDPWIFGIGQQGGATNQFGPDWGKEEAPVRSFRTSVDPAALSWPAFQPGPLDAYHGWRSHRVDIEFDLPPHRAAIGAPVEAYELLLAFFASHGPCPDIEIAVGGTWGRSVPTSCAPTAPRCSGSPPSPGRPSLAYGCRPPGSAPGANMLSVAHRPG